MHRDARMLLNLQKLLYRERICAFPLGASGQRTFDQDVLGGRGGQEPRDEGPHHRAASWSKFSTAARNACGCPGRIHRSDTALAYAGGSA